MDAVCEWKQAPGSLGNPWQQWPCVNACKLILDNGILSTTVDCNKGACSVRSMCPCHAGEVRIGVFAKEDIPVGSELTYDYKFQHYGLAAAAGAYR